METAILNEEQTSLPFLLYCLLTAVPRLDAQEVVELFISNGYIHGKRKNGQIHQNLYLVVLDDLDLGEIERVAVNKKALEIREQKRANHAGREGAELLRQCMLQLNEAQIKALEVRIEECEPDESEQRRPTMVMTNAAFRRFIGGEGGLARNRVNRVLMGKAYSCNALRARHDEDQTLKPSYRELLYHNAILRPFLLEVGYNPDEFWADYQALPRQTDRPAKRRVRKSVKRTPTLPNEVVKSRTAEERAIAVITRLKSLSAEDQIEAIREIQAEER